MASIAIVSDVKLNNLLYLTDFSEPAQAALPFVTAIARDYGSKIRCLPYPASESLRVYGA